MSDFTYIFLFLLVYALRCLFLFGWKSFIIVFVISISSKLAGILAPGAAADAVIDGVEAIEFILLF